MHTVHDLGLLGLGHGQALGAFGAWGASVCEHASAADRQRVLRFRGAEKFLEVFGVGFLQLGTGGDEFLEVDAAVVILIAVENRRQDVVILIESVGHFIEEGEQFVVG